MRTSTYFRLLLLAAMVVATAIWFHERAVATELQSRFAALRQQEQRLSSLNAERDRLREQLLAAASQTSRAPTAVADPELRRVEAPVRPAVFAVGEWTPAAAWKNEGRSTPRSTIATLLWAAVGGDLAAIQKVLEFDDATRAKARAWFETLPPATRSLYVTPENLVASVTIRNIPPTTAQLSWFPQTDAEHAIVGVMLAAPGLSVSEPTPIIDPSVGGTPPALAKHNANRLAVLALHRTSAGWRVVVPAAAIERMAEALSVATLD